MATMEARNITVGQMLRGHNATYSVVRSLGEGCFGKVVEGLNTDTMGRVAVKIMKNPAAIREAEDEVRMLERIGELDSDRCNVVSFKERFDHMGLTCLVFEMLDISLWDLVIDHKCALSPSEIRPIAQQLLVAFDALKDVGVIHSDLKPDNVMMTNRRLEPFRVKLIDFGLARPIAEVRQGQKKQPAGYRAPEVTLGCEFGVPIDMYGLGSTLALLLLEQHLFPASGYQSMKMMVDLLGMPPDDMIRDGLFSKYYFTKEEDDRRRPTWRLLTPEEFTRLTRVDPGQPSDLQKHMRTFDDLMDIFIVDDPEHLEDLRVFVDFLKGLLTVDPRLRLTPKQALQHAFITMTHLTEDSDYSKICKLTMQRFISTESDVHHRGQPAASPDSAQRKGPSEDSSSSPSASASSEGIFDRAVEPFALDLGLCEDESSSSSEELTSLSTDHSSSQPEEVYPVYINQHFDEEIVISSSEEELPSDAREDSSSDDGAQSGSSQWITKKEDGVEILLRISEEEISDTDDISQNDSYGSVTSDSSEDSPVIRVFSQPDDVYVASPCEPRHIQQNDEEKTTRLEVSDITVGQMLRGHNATYSVVRFLGEGSFGMVVEGLNLDRTERVALKMLKNPAAIREAEDEVRMLERIGELDSDRCNVVSFKERFDHMGLTCLVFEMLDISLWDLEQPVQRRREPLHSQKHFDEEIVIGSSEGELPPSEAFADSSDNDETVPVPPVSQTTRPLGLDEDLDVSYGEKPLTKALRDIAKSHFVKSYTATSSFDKACIVSTLEGFRESTAVLKAKKLMNYLSYSEEILLSSANVEARGGFWGVCDEMDKTNAAGPIGLSRQSDSPISNGTSVKSGPNKAICITLTYNSYVFWPMDVVTGEKDETEERSDKLEAALLHNSHSGKQDTAPMLSPQNQDQKRSRIVGVECLLVDKVVHGGELDLVVVFVRINLSWLQSGVVARVFVVLVWDPGG